LWLRCDRSDQPAVVRLFAQSAPRPSGRSSGARGPTVEPFQREPLGAAGSARARPSRKVDEARLARPATPARGRTWKAPVEVRRAASGSDGRGLVPNGGGGQPAADGSRGQRRGSSSTFALNRMCGGCPSRALDSGHPRRSRRCRPVELSAPYQSHQLRWSGMLPVARKRANVSRDLADGDTRLGPRQTPRERAKRSERRVSTLGTVAKCDAVHIEACFRPPVLHDWTKSAHALCFRRLRRSPLSSGIATGAVAPTSS